MVPTVSAARPVVPPDGVTQAWWDATREARLLIQRCEGCASRQFYPRAICSTCGHDRFSYVEAGGGGTIYSFTVVHRSPHEAFAPPYVVALVRLDEGPVMMTGIVEGEPRCDARVRLAWEDLPDGRKLPVFEMEG